MLSGTIVPRENALRARARTSRQHLFLRWSCPTHANRKHAKGCGVHLWYPQEAFHVLEESRSSAKQMVYSELFLHLLCCLLHNWLLEYDGRDDWEDVLDEDDCDVEYGSLESMVDEEARASTSGAGAGSWTRGQARRANPRAYMELPRHDDDESGGEAEAPPSATEQQEFRERRTALLDHYCHEVEHRRLELHLL
uniref:Uncharacterized protein n=1 Tax=Grammatophora oceanica TaxID=210454 RepID=A0A7S1YC49_9STRA|mmetsp:Transcript_3808/g.5177  ORF Transcript_3808/g.5177 Transcript_3808/m.5177 type:complete len:195 (+) Transcript_3808:694-1278(+)